LNLIDPDTLGVTSIDGFSATSSYSGGHDDGPTSVDEGAGKLYVTDRTSGKLLAIDPSARSITSSVPLGARPDYLRFVAATNELWVTEPGAQQLEIFKIGADGIPVHDALIALSNGPESLVIDNQRGRAYTHRWQKTTVAIDVTTRTIVGEWANACASSRGIALDETHGWLFSGCSEGTAAVLDIAGDGRIVSTIERGSGFDVIGYSPNLGHLYLAGSSCSCLIVLSVGAGGSLSFSSRSEAPSSTHCAAADDVGHAWVCDPDGGQLFRVDDTSPRSLP
jgi:YVTN family beta-propeller protein